VKGSRIKGLEKPGPLLPFSAEEVALRLLEWYGLAGRELPWRQTRDPYLIWLSEIMLQQTTVAAVIGYYRHFLERFPRLETLASAPLEEVIDLWAGLGYYARARNLHATARELVKQRGSEFPRSVEELMMLPGIGRSTAGAIAALAFDQSAPILDGNVRRIFCRLFALNELPRSGTAEKKLWMWAEALTPESRAHDYTQAIMDLGALICTPKKPRCDQCPLEPLCQAKIQNLVALLPLKTLGKKIPNRHQLALLLVDNGRGLIQRRPPNGLLGGLWEFPGFDATKVNPFDAIRQHCAGRPSISEIHLLGHAQHIYSHFRLEVDFYRVDLVPCDEVAETEEHWLMLDDLQRLPLHGAHKKLLPLIGA